MKKSIIKTLCLGALIIAGCTASVHASNDKIDYSITVGSYHINGRIKKEDARYRQTTNVNNPWKVRLDESSEGNGTITTFWLENSNEKNVSKSQDVKQGKGFHYDNPNATANQTTVYLTAQNNNYDAHAYTVSGKWDEETWN